MKQTEIGMIPDDWEVKEFGNYSTIVRGGSPRPIQDFITTNSSGINWIKIGDVKPNDKYIVKTEEKIIPAGKSRSREVNPGDFILSNSMSFGRPYILKINGCIHDGWLAIQNYHETFDVDYLYYLLGSDEVFKQYISMAAGSSVQNLNKQKVSKLLVALPPTLVEQQKIAKALSDVDNVISTLEKLITKKKNLKQGTMQQLLTGKKRLPGFAKSGKFKQTEIGEIPEDWEVKSLSSIGEVKMCKRVLKYQTSETGDIPFYKIGTFGKEPDSYISRELFNFLKNNYSYPKKGDILISAAGTIGRTVVFDGKDSFFQDSNIIWLENDESVILNIFLSYLFKVIKWQTEDGGIVSRLYNNNFRVTQIPIPSKPEQTAIANVLSSMDKEIEALEAKLRKYRNLKTGMMQQLLTGKIRLR